MNFVYWGIQKRVARSIKQVITETLQAAESTLCSYQYLNMPGNYFRPEGKEPRELSRENFLKEFSGKKYVYMGEQKSSVFLIPRERASEMPVTLDSEILFTDVRKLESADIKRIRVSK